MDRMNKDRIVIDGSRIASREEFFEEFRTKIKSQTGENILIGSNLDSLHDALTSISSLTSIEVYSQEALEAALGDYWKRILWVLNDCLDENRNLELQFCRTPEE